MVHTILLLQMVYWQIILYRDKKLIKKLLYIYIYNNNKGGIYG